MATYNSEKEFSRSKIPMLAILDVCGYITDEIPSEGEDREFYLTNRNILYQYINGVCIGIEFHRRFTFLDKSTGLIYWSRSKSAWREPADPGSLFFNLKSMSMLAYDKNKWVEVYSFNESNIINHDVIKNHPDLNNVEIIIKIPDKDESLKFSIGKLQEVYSLRD